MKTIADILSLGVSETLEFKDRFNADVIETAVAFANTRGGQILIGVCNHGKPHVKDDAGRHETMGIELTARVPAAHV